MRFLLFLCLLVSAANAQPLTDTQKLASLARVWGFLKYHHPAVATGKRDWDEQLTRLIPAVRQATDQQAVSVVYGQLLDELGAVTPCRRCKTASGGQRNLDLAWLTDSLVFTPDLQQRLTYLLENRYQGENYYAKPPGNSGYALLLDNEKNYADGRLPGRDTADESYRLLALFRYWNIIQYYYPYKYAIDGNWNDVLTALIPVFQRADTETTYQQALYRMVARLGDSHGFVENVDKSRCLRCELGTFGLPFTVKLIGSEAIITHRLVDSSAVPSLLTVGTAIRAIDGESVSDRINRLRPLIPASNEGAMRRDLRWFIGNAPANQARLTISRNGRDTTVAVPRYPTKTLASAARLSAIQPYPVSRWLADSIGYVNMGKLASPFRQVDSIMQPFLTARALIFDLRNYPKGTHWLVSRYLTGKSLPFILFTRPDLDFPGTFITDKPTWLPRAKGQAFGGKVVVLVDEETQSRAEFTAMAFQTVPGVTLVGSPTAGADGNIAWIPLPGGYRTAFSGLGVYYPDGRETQRVGIVPDVLVTPTAAGIRAGRDEVLDRALELARAVH